MNKRALLSEYQVKYVEYIIVKRDTEKLEVSRREIIQVIPDLGQKKSIVQADNHLDYLIQEKRLKFLKRHGIGGFRSDNDYITITYLCVTAVSLEHDD